MASDQCIIDDNECLKMGQYFLQQGKELDDMVSSYIGVLRYARLLAITKGDASDALKNFIDYAEKLKEQIGSISEDAQAQIFAFLTKVDDADQYVF